MRNLSNGIFDFLLSRFLLRPFVYSTFYLIKYMKVQDLINELSKMDPESEVILQKDSEGNGYSPLCGADHNAVYIPDSTWSGDVYDLKWSADDACMTEEEWNEIKTSKKCVVLYPIN